MALYIGNNKIKVNINGIIYKLNLSFQVPIINTTRLWSSDNYILKDSYGIYLIPKVSMVTNGYSLLSEDGYILKDKNDLYLIIEEVE